MKHGLYYFAIIVMGFNFVLSAFNYNISATLGWLCALILVGGMLACNLIKDEDK